jgi:hypothetical protein
MFVDENNNNKKNKIFIYSHRGDFEQQHGYMDVK